MMNARVGKLKTKIFADGADREGILALYRQPYIKGFTTNPTLMRKAGITDYAAFAKSILKEVPDRPFSFEVFADEMGEMERQAMIISQWGPNVYVKIPITNTRGESTKEVIRKLSARGLKLNITAMMTLQQVRDILPSFKGSPSSYVSIFAGRIADTGCDPKGLMKEAVALLHPNPALELIWASPRELLNIFDAEDVGCQVITVTHDILKKLELVGKNLDEYSLDTVRMFYEDGHKSGFTL
jgi:transaldolase